MVAASYCGTGAGGTTRMFLLYLLAGFFVHFTAPLSIKDFFHYPELRFCSSGGCLDFEDDAVQVLDTEPFPFYRRQTNRVVVSASCFCILAVIYA